MSRPAPRTEGRSWLRQDRHWIYLAALLRSTGLSMLAILAGAYLTALDLSSFQIGAISAAGLAGCTMAAGLVTLRGDRVGRRRALAAIAVLSCSGCVLLAVASAPFLLGGAAFLGMFNAMGRDRGAALVLEQAVLPATATAGARTAVFARYYVAQDIGQAAGAGAAALPLLLGVLGLAGLPALRWSIVFASLLIGSSAVVYACLS